eukprot:8916004-Pyramimonas_sp.AAC.1
MRVAPRSGPALDGGGITSGAVDPDYPEEIEVIVCHAIPRTHVVEQGHRLARVILELQVNDDAESSLPPSYQHGLGDQVGSDTPA